MYAQNDVEDALRISSIVELSLSHSVYRSVAMYTRYKTYTAPSIIMIFT